MNASLLVMAMVCSVVLTLESQNGLHSIDATNQKNEIGTGLSSSNIMEDACTLALKEAARTRSSGQKLEIPALDRTDDGGLAGTAGRQGYQELTKQYSELAQRCEELKKLLGDVIDKTAKQERNKDITNDLDLQVLNAEEQEVLSKFKKEWAESFCIPNCK